MNLDARIDAAIAEGAWLLARYLIWLKDNGEA
jgi:hypothetical protein